MTARVVRRAAAAAGLLAALTGCSFRASAGDAAAARPSGAPPAATASPVDPVAAAPAPTTGSTTRPAPRTTRAPSTAAAVSSAPAPAAQASTASSADRCRTGGLSAAVTPGPSGAGQRSATVVLRNTGARACTLDGYGGIGLVDAGGQPVPTRQVRITPPAPAPVTLPPGATASSELRWSAVPGAADAATGSCQPVAAELRVIPPDETDALPVPWQGGPVCEGGTVDQQPYGAG